MPWALIAHGAARGWRICLDLRPGPITFSQPLAILRVWEAGWPATAASCQLMLALWLYSRHPQPGFTGA